MVAHQCGALLRREDAQDAARASASLSSWTKSARSPHGSDVFLCREWLSFGSACLGRFLPVQDLLRSWPQSNLG
jgi:hypothetical protein